MNPGEHFQGHFTRRCFEFERLATDHAVPADGLVKHTECGGEAVALHCIRQFVEGLVSELQELVAGEQCDAFVEFSMQGGLSSPEVVVIQGGQIVMDQGEQVNEFNGPAEEGSCQRLQSEPRPGFMSQSRTQAFSRTFEGIEDGVPEAGARTLPEQEALNQVLVEAVLRKHVPKLASFRRCFNHNH